jgi:hypothetical protein
MRVPRAIRLAKPDALALRFAARPLLTAFAHVRLEPSSAYATRTLLAHNARDDHSTTSSSPTACPRPPPSPIGYVTGSLLKSRCGSFLASVEDHANAK